MNLPLVLLHVPLTLNVSPAHVSAKLVTIKLIGVSVKDSLATFMLMIVSKFLSIHRVLGI